MRRGQKFARRQDSEPFLFDRQNPELMPRDTHVTEPCEIRRLSAQNAAILARLQRCPASNRELVEIAINFRARISDLRAAGYNIPAPVEDRASGVAWYRLDDRTA